jgi:MFS family permease
VTATAGTETRSVLAIVLGAVLVPLNSTMIAVALPDIARAFDVTKGTTSILVIVYLVVMLVGQPVLGRAADRFGARPVLFVGLGGLAVTSLLAALAPTFPLLVLARMAQASFAAALQPSIQSMLRLVTARERRGRTFGLLGSAASTGAALGPIVGGLVIALAGWEAIFLVNIPVVVVVLVLLRRVPDRRTTAPTVTEGAATVGRIRNPVFITAFVVQATTTLAQYALLLAVPLILDERGWGSAAVGLALTALTIGSIVVGPPGGRVGDQYGSRLPTTVGVALAAGSVAVLAVGGPSVAAVVLIVAITVFGFGFGLAAPNLMTAALESVAEARTGAAGGLFSTARYLGSIPASIVFGVLVDEGTGGVHAVLIVAAVSTAVALAATPRLPTRA